jgi:hypothetical protein
VGNVQKAFPGVVQVSRLDNEGIRTVTFSSGQWSAKPSSASTRTGGGSV